MIETQIEGLRRRITIHVTATNANAGIHHHFRPVVEDVIGPLLRSASVDLPSHMDPTISEAHFLTDLAIETPTRRHEIWRDEL